MKTTSPIKGDIHHCVMRTVKKTLYSLHGPSPTVKLTLTRIYGLKKSDRPANNILVFCTETQMVTYNPHDISGSLGI